jgi:hypothetical protein
MVGDNSNKFWGNYQLMSRGVCDFASDLLMVRKWEILI